MKAEYINLMEIEVFGEPAALNTEIISPSEAKMSSTWPGYPASNCIDGNHDSMCHTHGLGPYPWVTLVIPRSIVREIRITNRRDVCCWERMKNMKVWVGSDFPNTAIEEYTGGTLLGTFLGPGTQGQVLSINAQEEVVGTHVVAQMKTDYINLMEIEVFGEPASDTGCLTGWVHYNKKCYYFAQNTKVATWEYAVDNCYRMFMGSYPPSITSQEEQDFLTQRLEDEGNENVFIGAYYNRDRWTWWDGSPWDFSNWSESEPSGQNKRCSTMVRSGSGHLEWKWKDVSCEDNSKLAPLVCSYGGQNSCSDDRCKIGQSRMKRETNDNALRMTNSIARPGRIRRSVAHSMTWDKYHSIEDMYSYWDYLEDEYDFVSTESIGKSYEGEDMRILKVCHGGCGNKFAIWIDGGIHAREWISPATATYIAKELIENDEDHTELTRSIDWYILPIINPDG